MPIELPNLDDKTYADLVEEARASLPGIYPPWTDHNPSDPGIALIELFAWLSEMLLYRTNRIPERSYRTFLKLLNGRDHEPSPDQPLDEAIRATMVGLRERWRAVTTEDYEVLATTQWPASPQGLRLSAPRRVIRRMRALSQSPEKIALIVAPEIGFGDPPWLGPNPDLLVSLDEFFDERRLITTRFHVTGPSYVKVGVSAVLYIDNDVRSANVAAAASAALVQRLHPWEGGVSGGGWPFGRNVQTSEVLALLDGVHGVSYADGAALTLESGEDPVARIITEAGAPVGVRLDAHELPRLGTIHWTMKERRGGTWTTINP